MGSFFHKVAQFILQFLIANVVLFVLLFILFGVPIFCHEMGHYLAFQERGVPVRVFQLGIGPEVTLYRTEYTEFNLAPVLFMGYNMPYMEGDEESDAIRKAGLRVYEDLSPVESLWVMSAGLIANFFTAVFLFLVFCFIERKSSFIESIALNAVEAYRALVGMFVDIISLGRYPSKKSKYLKAMRGYVSLEKNVTSYVKTWFVLSFGLLVFNLFPISGLDGSKMFVDCCGMLGLHLDPVTWITKTSWAFFVIVIGRSFMKRKE